MTKSAVLRRLFNEKDVIYVVGAHDGLSAKLVANNGFDAVWASGLEISASYAVPDANILTMSQYLERACEMNDAVSIPVVADCDTGYGNSNNVIHMVKKYEAAGIAAVCIEDKKFPKANSLLSEGRQELISIAEFVGKIMAAKNAQAFEDFMVIARVEALIAGWGVDEALKRAQDYADAGADAILIHSKANHSEEIKAFCQRWDQRVPLVIVPTTYPVLPVGEMKRLGIKMVIYANQGIRASIKALNTVFSEIRKSGDLSTIGDFIVPLNDIFELQGMRQLKESEKLFLRGGTRSVKVIIPSAGDPSYERSLQNIVQDCPIAMLDINGKSILQRNIETLSKVGIYDVTVVTGYNAHRFTAEGVNYIENKNFKETSQIDSVMIAEEKLKDNIIVAFSDVLFEKEIITRLLDFTADIILVIDSSISQNRTSVDYVRTETSPACGERKMILGKLNKILKAGKEIKPEQANFEFIGLAYFSQKGIDILKESYGLMKKKESDQASGKNDFLAVIQAIIDSGVVVSGMEVNGGWIEIRNFENYRLAHAIF